MNKREEEVFATAADTILPLTKSAMGSLQDMGGTMRLSPMCHEATGAQHEIRGWVLDLPGAGHASTLPVPHNLFHGVSVALCDASEKVVEVVVVVFLLLFLG